MDPLIRRILPSMGDPSSHGEVFTIGSKHHDTGFTFPKPGSFAVTRQRRH
jgi:hypothetical protein